VHGFSSIKSVTEQSFIEVVIVAKRLLVVLGSFFILTSCKIGNDVIVVSTISPSVTSTIALTPTQIGTPTVSPDVVSYQCLDIADQPPSNYILKGTLVSNNYDNTDAFLWNNDTKNVYRFPREEGDRLFDFDVSPDRKHITYRHLTASNDKFVVATADGKTVSSQVNDFFLWNWFDNQRLIGLTPPQNGTPSLFLLNPFTSQRQELRFDYPDSRMFSNDPSARWRYTNGGFPIYDPTLTRVLYPECTVQCQNKLIRGEGGWPISLWKTETNQVIARLMTMDSYGGTPLWAPDGKQFIIATNIDSSNRNRFAREFFAMSRDGQLRQLTHFMDYFEEVNIPDSYSLSPNGKLVAFWIIAEPNQYEDARLAVLNIENSKVVNYCIQSDGFLEPIWSPDGTQLLVVAQDSQAPSNKQEVLVDLVRHYAANIGEADYVRPVGWMVSP
jgi:hypothetical protein